MKALKFSEEVVQIKKMPQGLSRSALSAAIKPFWTAAGREAYRNAAAPITGRGGAYGRLWTA